MPIVPTKVSERLSAGIKRFQPILASAKSRDVNESDTVIIVTDMMADIFGYDKYSEITSEFSIRGTFCDLAIKLDGSLQFLIEVKAIGLDLKESYIKQAVDYSANQGSEWVLLTNGEIWRVFKVSFSKPIEQELVLQFNFAQLNPKKADDLELVYHITREGWLRSALGDFHAQKQALSRFFLAAMVTGDGVLDVIRKEIRKLSPDVRISNDQIRTVLMQEVLKREVVEGEKAEEAKKRVQKVAGKVVKSKQPKTSESLATREEKETAGSNAMELKAKENQQRQN